VSKNGEGQLLQTNLGMVGFRAGGRGSVGVRPFDICMQATVMSPLKNVCDVKRNCEGGRCLCSQFLNLRCPTVPIVMSLMLAAGSCESRSRAASLQRISEKMSHFLRLSLMPCQNVCLMRYASLSKTFFGDCTREKTSFILC
jgi:hypothetical protein